MIKEIKVLGLGCINCEKLFNNVKECIGKKGLDVSLEYVTDMNKIQEYDVMRMPAVVIDGKVVSEGKVLSVKEVDDVCLMYL